MGQKAKFDVKSNYWSYQKLFTSPKAFDPGENPTAMK